jgi:diacylglycerol O-acyltransferase / wax synthase
MKTQTDGMTGVDKMMLHMDYPGTPMVITGFIQFHSPLNFSRVKKQLQDRLLCHDKFTKRVVRPAGSDINTPKWETDTHFDLGSHLFSTPVPAPGGEDEVRELFRELATAPLDPSKPLWEVHYIEQACANRSFLYFRIHHCMADGMAMTKLLASLTDGEPFPEKATPLEGPPEEAASGRKRLCRNACRLASKEIQSVISDPGHAKRRARHIGMSLNGMLGTLTRVMMLPPDSTHFFGETPGGRARQTAWTSALSLSDIKKTGAHFNATVNDILVAITVGGIRRYINQKGTHPDGKAGIRMAIPVNLRPRGVQDEPGVALKNAFGFVLATLPIYIKDPGRRVHRIRNLLDRLKQSPDAGTAWMGLNLLGLAPGEVARKTAFLLSEKITGIISNVPGPGQKRYFAGEPIENIMFWLPLIKGLCMGVSIISYDNGVSLGIISDTDVVPDPEAIIGHIEDEFKSLLDICD